jgi:hypothetical protein
MRPFPWKSLLLVFALADPLVAGETRPAPRTDTKLHIELLTEPREPGNPLGRRGDIDAPRDTRLGELVAVLSDAASTRVRVDPELEAERLLILARAQDLDRLLRRAANLMNATLLRESVGEQPAYRITQTRAQRQAEAALVNAPMHELLEALNGLADPTAAAGPITASFVRNAPGLANLVGSLGPDIWARLTAGFTVRLNPAALPSEALDDLRRMAVLSASRNAELGLPEPTGAPVIHALSLRIDSTSGHTPGIRLSLSSSYGNRDTGLTSVRPIGAYSGAPGATRALAGIPAEPGTLAASPEIDLSDLDEDYTTFRLVEEIGRRGGINVIARHFRYPPMRGMMPWPANLRRRGPALDLLVELCRERRLVWSIVDDVVLITVPDWPFARQRELPDADLDRWLKAADEGKLSNQHVIEMAQLTDPQLRYLQSFFSGPAIDAYRNAAGLRAWGRLSPAQQRAARRGGLPVEALPDVAKHFLARALGDSLEVLADRLRGSALVAEEDEMQFSLRLALSPEREHDIVRLRRRLANTYFPPGFPPKEQPEKTPDESRVLRKGTATQP